MQTHKTIIKNSRSKELKTKDQKPALLYTIVGKLLKLSKKDKKTLKKRK